MGHLRTVELQGGVPFSTPLVCPIRNRTDLARPAPPGEDCDGEQDRQGMADTYASS